MECASQLCIRCCAGYDIMDGDYAIRLLLLLCRWKLAECTQILNTHSRGNSWNLKFKFFRPGESWNVA